MITRLFYRLTWLGLLVLIVVSATLALAATNTVPETGADETILPITANDLKPPECAGLNLVDVRLGGSSGGNTNSLILGTAGNDNIRGRGGSDCILGGSGNDTLDGDQSNDIILGGAGDDTLIGDRGNDTLYGGAGNDFLNGGAGTDDCYGQGGTDTFHNSCETQVQ